MYIMEDNINKAKPKVEAGSWSREDGFGEADALQVLIVGTWGFYRHV